MYPTVEDLIRYHRETYNGDAVVREFVLTHEAEIFGLEIDRGTEASATDDHQNTDMYIDMDTLELDVENLVYEYDEEDPRHAKYLEQKRKHRQRFLKEIKEKGLRIEEVKQRSKPMNY